MECNVVKDLLPLYIDSICSENSRKCIEEHLVQCSKCREVYEMMASEEACTDVSMDNFMEIQPLKKVKEKQKKKTRMLLFLFLACLAVCMILLVKNFSEKYNQLSFEVATTEFHEVLQKINAEVGKKWDISENAILELSGSKGIIFAPATGMNFQLYAGGKRFDVICTCYGESGMIRVYVNRQNTDRKGYGISWNELLKRLDEVETNENLETENYILLLQLEEVNLKEALLTFYEFNPEEKKISNATAMQYSIPVISIEMSE